MKKIYTYPAFELVRISSEDVMTASIGLKVGGTYTENDPISMEDGFTAI